MAHIKYCLVGHTKPFRRVINREIVCVYRENVLIDAWGNRCERGSIATEK